MCTNSWCLLMSRCLFPWTDNPCCFSFFFKSLSESKLYTVLGSGFLLWTELKREKRDHWGLLWIIQCFSCKTVIYLLTQYQGDWKNSRTIKTKTGKRRRIKFTNKVDSIFLTVMHLKWQWDIPIEGSRWQPKLRQS